MKTIKTKCSQCNGTGEVNQDRRGVDGNTCDWCCGKGYNLELMTKQKKLDGILESLYSQGVDYGTELFYLMAITQAKKEIIGLLLSEDEVNKVVNDNLYNFPKAYTNSQIVAFQKGIDVVWKDISALVTKQKERFV